MAVGSLTNSELFKEVVVQMVVPVGSLTNSELGKELVV